MKALRLKNDRNTPWSLYNCVVPYRTVDIGRRMIYFAEGPEAIVRTLP
jgi:hypothetical protein